MARHKKPAAIWCEHCRAEISPAGIKGCIRKTCESKAMLAQVERERLAA